MQVLQIMHKDLQTMQPNRWSQIKDNLTLTKKDVGSSDDTNFVELVTIKRGGRTLSKINQKLQNILL